MCTVEVNLKTLEGPVHSGMFGGPAPDALTALIQMLNTLHDKNGNVTIKNLDSVKTAAYWTVLIWLATEVCQVCYGRESRFQ